MAKPKIAIISGPTATMEFVRASGDGTGPGELEYRVRLRKRDEPADFVSRLRSAAGPLVRSATLKE